MRSVCIVLTIALTIALVGCNNGTPGGPGIKSSGEKKPIVGNREETFSLTTPTLATRMKQGETKEISIGIKRGKNMTEDVTLKFDKIPKGVTIEPKTASIKHDKDEEKITVKAADDAALGDFTVQVIGHPTNGADAMKDLKLTIDKK